MRDAIPMNKVAGYKIVNKRAQYDESVMWYGIQ